MKRFFGGGKPLSWLFSSLVIAYFFAVTLFDSPLYPRGLPKLEILLLAVVWLVAALLVFLFGKAIFPLVTGVSARRRIVWGLVALLTAWFLVLVIPLQPQKVSIQQPVPARALEWLLYLPDLLWISFLVFALSVWLVLRPAQVIQPERLSKRTIVFYAAPMFGVWSLYLLAYWPGGMSPDSIDQWTQMLAFKFTDWHPVFHTLTNWLITRLWLSPAAVVLAQIFFLSLVLAWGLSTIRNFGAPRWLPWLTIAFLVVTPSTGLMAIMLWKDVFFSIAMVALTIQVFKITLTDGEWVRQPGAWAYLGLVAALVALYRQNGPPVAFGTLLCLLIVYRILWKPLTFALVLAVFLWLGIRGPVYDWLGVNKATPSSTEMALAHVLASYTNSNTPILPAERALLHQIRPDQVWPYDCYMESTLFFDGKFTYTGAKDFDLAVLAARLIARNPQVFLGHLICNSSFVYQITQTPGTKYEMTAPYIIPNQLGFVSDSKLPGLKTILDSWTAFSVLFFSWLFWRTPFWDYLLLAGILIYWARSKNWKTILVLVPLLTNLLPLAVLTAGQAFRYVFPTFLVGVLLSGYFIFARTVVPEA